METFLKYPMWPDKETFRSLFHSDDCLKGVLERNDGGFEL